VLRDPTLKKRKILLLQYSGHEKGKVIIMILQTLGSQVVSQAAKDEEEEGGRRGGEDRGRILVCSPNQSLWTLGTQAELFFGHSFFLSSFDGQIQLITLKVRDCLDCCPPTFGGGPA